MPNEIAPEGAVWVCQACGKRSRDKYGDQKIDEWWDESCYMHAVLVREDTIVLEDGRVTYAEAWALQ